MKPYWVNTSLNGLVSRLIRQGNPNIKMQFENPLNGHSPTGIDEEIVYNQLGQNENEIWSLLLACGYLAVEKVLLIGDLDWMNPYMNRTCLNGMFGRRTGR